MELQKADNIARELAKLALDNGVGQGHTEVITKASEMDPYTAISLRNQKQPLLLRLLAELRNKIYGYVFRDLCITPRLCFKNKALYVTCKDKSVHTSIQNCVLHPVSLLLVCRQIYADVALLPFQLSEFRINTGMSDHAFHHLLGALTEEQRIAIRHVSSDALDLSVISDTKREFWENQHDYHRSMNKPLPYEASLPLEKLPGLRLVTIEVGRPFDYMYLAHLLDKQYLRKLVTQLGAHVGVDLAIEWDDQGLLDEEYEIES